MRRRLVILLLCLSAFARAQSLGAQSLALLRPVGVAYDPAGNLYFADTNRHQVFESTLAGALIVVAGSGVQGFAGDGSAATAASLNAPQSVAVGADGTVYIADTGNQRIRVVATAGTISTFAGTGAPGYGGDNGAATAAVFSRPNALAIDSSGALLVCDSGNHRVRRIAGGIITTVAGSGVQGFGGDGGPASVALLDTPSGVAVSADGRIFIADTHNDRIRMIATNGTITTFAGTGVRGYFGDGSAATVAELALPQGLSMTSAGTLLIADSNNERIRMVNAQGTISTLAGNGVQGSSADGGVVTGALNTPRGMTLSSFAAPVFSDTANKQVREMPGNGSLYAPAGLTPSRSSSVALTLNQNAISGQSTATIGVTGSAGIPQGAVQLLDGTTLLGQTTLSAGSATIATGALSAGSHALSAAYLGDGINPAATSAVSNITAARAISVTTEQTSSTSYAGLPLALSATVASTATGTPTGTVSFLDGSTTVATATLSGGSALSVYLSPAAGSHSIVASYSGDGNFLPSSSVAVITSVGAMPDFTLASSGSAAQTVQGGQIAIFTFSVGAQSAPFTGVVDMSLSGLPTGATASFSPPQVVPGTSSAAVTLSIQTTAQMAHREALSNRLLWALLLPLLPGLRMRRARGFAAICVVMSMMIITVGCGDRTLSAASQPSQSYAMTVVGTSTNLAGSLVVHNTPITLTVQ